MKLHRIERHLLGTLLASALAAAAGQGHSDVYAVIGSDLLHVLEQTGPAPVILRELSVVAAGVGRQVVLDKCADVGEPELSRLAQTAEVEEAFAFIPDLCVWVDVGVEQTGSSVRVERRVVDGLVTAFGRVVVYHIHPVADGGGGRYLPAYSDLLAVVLINSRYSAEGEVEILHRAVTPADIFEYSFQPSGIGAQMLSAIFSTGLARAAGENLLLSYSGPERENEYYDAIRRCPALLDGAGGNFGSCFPMQAGDFLVILREHLPQ